MASTSVPSARDSGLSRTAENLRACPLVDYSLGIRSKPGGPDLAARKGDLMEFGRGFVAISVAMRSRASFQRFEKTQVSPTITLTALPSRRLPRSDASIAANTKGH